MSTTAIKSNGHSWFLKEVSAAKNRVCQGCRTSMTEVQFNELRRGAFRTCITCGRMQYPAE